MTNVNISPFLAAAVTAGLGAVANLLLDLIGDEEVEDRFKRLDCRDELGIRSAMSPARVHAMPMRLCACSKLGKSGEE